LGEGNDKNLNLPRALYLHSGMITIVTCND
jgi:hypothetical protein